MASQILRISESRHYSTTKISQNNLLHVHIPFGIKNALYFMPTAWIGLIGLKYEISLIFYRWVRESPNFYRTFTYHRAYDILHEKSIYCLNRPNWLEIPISCEQAWIRPQAVDKQCSDQPEFFTTVRQLHFLKSHRFSGLYL